MGGVGQEPIACKQIRFLAVDSGRVSSLHFPLGIRRDFASPLTNSPRRHLISKPSARPGALHYTSPPTLKAHWKVCDTPLPLPRSLKGGGGKLL